MKKNIITYIVIAVIVGAGGFFGGMTYAQSNGALQTNVFGQRGNGSQQGGRQGGQGGQFMMNGAGGQGGARGGNLANGEIISKDDKSVTIKLRNGSSQFIFFSPTTQILKSTTGTAEDLTNGENVIATGTTNSDGSVTAQMIQIRPAGETFMMGRGAGTQQVTPPQNS